MPAKRSSLGRGLDALLPKSPTGIQQINIDALSVSEYQPRKHIDPEAIAELAASISDKGILQPLVVRPTSKGYEIVAGERRFRAAQKVGLASVPAVVKELSDQETLEIAIIENLQREDLSAVEEARAFKQLMGFGLNQEKVAKAVGKSRSAIANTLRLLKLPSEALEALEQGKLSAGHARAILAQPEEEQVWALRCILERELTVRQAEELSRETEKESKTKESKDKTIVKLEEDLARHVGAKVKLKGLNKGRLELYYHSKDELERILSLLNYQA